MLHAMIMAGGGGTRFWPRSRQARPKQFLAVVGERTLLQQAVDRLESTAIPANRCWIVTGKDYIQETRQQVPSLPPGNIIGEPCGRDTAPCIGLAAAIISRQDPDAVMVVTPADHIIEPSREFQRAVHVAEQMTQEHPGAIITFGIPPTFPSTGYGYIHRGQSVANRQGIHVFRVASFKEKPKLAQAEEFLASGQYFWNSGIFVWKVSTLLSALHQHRPTLHAAISRMGEAWGTPRQQEVLEREYPNLEKVSIDYAVMEHHADVLVVQAPYRWDDVGSWLSVERLHPQDTHGNTVLGGHEGVQTRNCVIVGEPGKLIATVGVEDLIIIQDGDCTLVTHRSQEGAVKNLVEQMRAKKMERHL
ncbi:MAG: mannose-1-phosphate guanylyltransferase [Gemmataceae bacterium]